MPCRRAEQLVTSRTGDSPASTVTGRTPVGTRREVADLVLSAGAVVTMDAERRIIRDGAVAVRGRDIVAVGKRDELLRRFDAIEHIDAPQGMLTPGLVDAHNHPAGAFLIKGLVDEKPQMRRLKDTVVPHEQALTPRQARVASLASFAEMIRHGTTTFADAGGPHTAETAGVAEQIGIRGVLAPQTSDLAGPFGRDVPTTAEVLAVVDDIADRFDGAADGRLKVWYDLDVPAAVSDGLVQGVVSRAHARGAGVVGHFVAPPGGPVRNPDIERYERLGVLDTGPVLAHIGWLSENDVARLAASPATIAHCPSSSLAGGNGWVAHGVIPDLVAAGARVVLGTDGAAISRFLDLVRVMYLAACCHKDVRRDPTVMGAHQVFEMVTVNAARALRWEDRIGSIAPGMAADLVVFDLGGLAYSPNRFANPIADLVYGGSGTDAVIAVIDGTVVMRDRKLLTVDHDDLETEVDQVAEEALALLGGPARSVWPIV
jgi:5-methylthioadenosine/S-adenosylhomocysteine deaminase